MLPRKAELEKERSNAIRARNHVQPPENDEKWMEMV